MFATNSAEISDRGKADLDRVAQTIGQQRMTQVELRAFAGGADPSDARRVALARALARASVHHVQRTNVTPKPWIR